MYKRDENNTRKYHVVNIKENTHIKTEKNMRHYIENYVGSIVKNNEDSIMKI